MQLTTTSLTLYNQYLDKIRISYKVVVSLLQLAKKILQMTRSVNHEIHTNSLISEINKIVPSHFTLAANKFSF